MSKQIKITPTDALYAEIETYAKKHNIKSLARASVELVAHALGFEEVAANQHGGDRTQLMQCGWCGYQQKVHTWQDECRNCGECEFLDIKDNQ